MKVLVVNPASRAIPHRSSPSIRRNLFALAVAGLFAGPVPSALAATIDVDGATCTLADAVGNANFDDDGGGNGCTAGDGADTINLMADALVEFELDIDTDITLEGNGHTVSRTGDAGGSIFDVNDGPFVLNQTTVTGGDDSGRGGGLDIYSANVTVSNSTISGNFASRGGGIYCSDYSGETNSGSLTILNSTISGNQASRRGAGVYVGDGCKANTLNSTISGNTADSRGGGIFVYANAYDSNLTVTDSTIVDNVATYGGGGGIFADDFTTVTLLRSMVAGNRASYGAEIFVDDATVTSEGGNLFGHRGVTSDDALFDFTPDSSDLTATSDGTDPTLLGNIRAALADNGGDTLTHGLVTGGPAIDAAGAVCSATDQRGETRPAGDACDIGAFEGEVDPDEDDADRDGLADDADNCPNNANFDQTDTDADGRGNVCDASPLGLCDGIAVTIRGTSRADTLVGTSRRDVISGLGGPDTLRGLGGDDLICGDSGVDNIDGGSGKDRLLGGNDNDIILGGDGDDVLKGGAQSDSLDGGKGRDTCDGGPNNDFGRNCEKRSSIP